LGRKVTGLEVHGLPSLTCPKPCPMDGLQIGHYDRETAALSGYRCTLVVCEKRTPGRPVIHKSRIMPALPANSLLAITGINGYIASHTLGLWALGAGHRVRGTVRSWARAESLKAGYEKHGIPAAELDSRLQIVTVDSRPGVPRSNARRHPKTSMASCIPFRTRLCQVAG
jgi:hypothetical protein